MDLFVVNRYEGEEKKENNSKQEESNHLERLLAKIAEKKREAEKVKDIPVPNEEALKKLQEKKKLNRLKKKNKKEKILNDGLLESADTELVAPSQPKSKNKGQKFRRKAGEGTNDLEGKFTIIGDDKLGARKTKVEAVLPYWLANPSVVSVDLQNLTYKIDDIPQLDHHLVKKLRKNGITHFFPVQHQVIPWLLEAQGKPPQFWPQDICVSAPTGSGKTLAFVLPIIQALLKRVVPEVRALVVLPVQELAAQVFDVFRLYAEGTSLRVALVTGKESFQQEQSKLVRYSEASKQYRSQVDIVVTTPGRLVDHMQTTTGFSLQHLKYLVIDEADRIMDSMQNDWLYHLERHISTGEASGYGAPPLTVSALHTRNPPPQKLLFSATLSQDPEKLQQLGLFQPRLFTSVVTGSAASAGEGVSSGFVGKFTTPAELSEHWVTCEPDEKPLILYHLITSENWHGVLVFTSTVDGVHRLAVLLNHLLKGKVKVSEMSSAVSPKQRKQICQQFSKGDIDLLVSSDALARGIDIPNVDYVVSYDAPKFIKNYIHRVGRTGRAGRQGKAITLVEPRQKNKFDQMLDQAGKREILQEIVVETADLEPHEDLYKESLCALKQQLEKEEEDKKAMTKKIKKKSQLKFKKKKLKGIKKSSAQILESKKLTKRIKHHHKENKRAV